MRRDHQRHAHIHRGRRGGSNPFLADARGFTLMEILIAMSTFLIVLFAIYTSFESSRSTYAAGEQKADIQQNARIAMELMGADLRLAGYGFPTGAGNAITGANATSITFWADIAGNSTTIMGPPDVVAGTTTFNVEDASGIQVNDFIYLINGGTWEQRQVQSVNTGVNPHVISIKPIAACPAGSQLSGSQAGTCNVYPWGSQVGRPRQITYSWNAGTLSKDDGEGGGLQPLADNIQLPAAPDTLFAYFDASDAPTGTLANIRKIRINLSAQSPAGWWRQQTFNIISDVRPRNL